MMKSDGGRRGRSESWHRKCSPRSAQSARCRNTLVPNLPIGNDEEVPFVARKHGGRIERDLAVPRLLEWRPVVMSAVECGRREEMDGLVLTPDESSDQV